MNPTKPKNTETSTAATPQPISKVKRFRIDEWMPPALQEKFQEYHALVDAAEAEYERSQNTLTDAPHMTAAEVRAAIEQKSSAMFDCTTNQIKAMDLLEDAAGGAVNALTAKLEAAYIEQKKAHAADKRDLQALGIGDGDASLIIRDFGPTRTRQAEGVVAGLELLHYSWRDQRRHAAKVREMLLNERARRGLKVL